MRIFAFTLALVALILLPYYAISNTMITIATQTLVWVVLALSYNILLGQTGLLSFCHAIFFGVGAFACSHIIVAADGGSWSGWPVWLTPVIAFVVGAIIALLLGTFLATRTGVAFVMITLALSQLVIYLVNSFDSIFGGEAGIGIDRAYDDFLFGLASFGPQRESYWLVLFWTLLSIGLMWLLKRTSFGSLAQCTRENEERVLFSGQSVRFIRLLALSISGGFAALAGSLHAINIEQVSVEQFSLKVSAFALFMCVIGGSRYFFGPIIGAVALSILDKLLPEHTNAWLLYLGIIFIVIILCMPTGIAGLANNLWMRYAHGFGTHHRWDVVVFCGIICIALGTIMMVEMASSVNASREIFTDTTTNVLIFSLDSTSVLSWAIAGFFLVTGIVMFVYATKKRMT